MADEPPRSAPARHNPSRGGSIQIATFSPTRRSTRASSLSSRLARKGNIMSAASSSTAPPRGKKQRKSVSRERESFSSGDDWQIVGGNQQQQQASAQRPRPTPAFIEEIHEGDDDADAGPTVSNKPKQVKVANLPPKGGAGSGGPALTALQRKAMQQRNKNSVKGLGNKPPRGGGSVEIEDADELINEEDQMGGSGSDEEAESESGASDDDDAIWDTPAQLKAKKQAEALAAAHAKANPPSRWSFLSSLLLWGALALLAAGLIWVRLQDASLFGAGLSDIDMQPPSEDLYVTLGVERTAALKDIKAAYRKQVLATHPDKNPNCADCTERFQAVQKAYDVLSVPEKRSMYDSIETTFDLLPSDSVELTRENFEREVLLRDDVWVIELYTDWHKNAIRFSQAWEEALARYGGLVRFGRIHAHREATLAKTLPVKFGLIPSVVLYANGAFVSSKTFLEGSHTALAKLANFIASEYPNTVESVPNTQRGMREFMRRAKDAPAGSMEGEKPSVLFFPDFVKQAANARKHPRPQQGSQQQRFQQQMLQNDAQKINEPSLTLKAIARKYEGAFAFGQVQQLSVPEHWQTWIKNISTAYKLTPPAQLPALLYQEDAASTPKWLTGDLKKEKLLAHMDMLHRRLVPWMNSHAYARHCVDSSAKKPTICVLGLACDTLRNPAAQFASFASSAKSMRNTAAFKNAPLQFAKVDVALQTDMAPLCAAVPVADRTNGELTIVAVGAHATELYLRKSGGSSQELDVFLQHVVKQDGRVTPITAPYVPVIHVPADQLPLQVPGFGLVLVPLKWLYGGAIVFALWMAAPIISKHFGSFLYVIFALSIALPAWELCKDVYLKYVA